MRQVLIGVLAAYNSAGQPQWTKLMPLADGWQTIFSVTVSGNQIIAAGQVVIGSYWSANQLTALAVPEPTGASVLLICGMRVLACRRGRECISRYRPRREDRNSRSRCR